MKILRLNIEAVFAGWPIVYQLKKPKKPMKKKKLCSHIKYMCSECFEFQINVYFNWKYLGKSILEKWAAQSWIGYLTPS